jgi:hypothetical protein
MKKLLIIAVFIVFGTVSLHAQGELNIQQKVFFRNEISFGILLNSDGFGVSYREAARVDYLNKRLLEFEGGILKHPKEYKISNPANQSQSTYVFGKLNSVFYLRAGFGHQKELYKKADLGGIAIRYFYTVGPVMAVYKPIYYTIYPTVIGAETREEKFDITFSQEIYGRASFVKGLNETKILPGLFAKGGMNFEYSKEDKVIHAIEVGAQINAFPKVIPIMASSDNKSVYFSLFVSYRFGLIINPLDPESGKLSNIFKRKKE